MVKKSPPVPEKKPAKKHRDTLEQQIKKMKDGDIIGAKAGF